MKEYIIREDNSNKYWPFQVIDPEDGKPLRDRFPTRERAQKFIDSLNAPLDEGILGILTEVEAAWENRFDKPLHEPEKPEPKQEVCFVESNPRQVGEVIKDKNGHEYVVSQASWYVSENDAADMEDANDVQLSVGWHTPARLI